MPTTGQPQASSRAPDHQTTQPSMLAETDMALKTRLDANTRDKNTVQATGPPQDAPVPATGQQYSCSTPSTKTHHATAATACRMQLQAHKSRIPRLLAVQLPALSAPPAAQQHTRPAKPFCPWYIHHTGPKTCCIHTQHGTGCTCPRKLQIRLGSRLEYATQALKKFCHSRLEQHDLGLAWRLKPMLKHHQTIPTPV